MFQLAIVLLVVGILFLAAEMILAGADFGISGGIGILALIASGVIMAVFVPGGIIYAIIMAVLVIVGIIVFVKVASKRGMLKKLVMDEALAEDPNKTIDLSGFEGKKGVALTPMRPIGTVDFGGVPVEAYSVGVFIEKGDKVVVTNFAENRLFVKPAGKDDGPKANR